MKSALKISIITVVRNGVMHIENTILSIIGQTYENIEYIVIDGGSNDGTLEIISKYESKIAYWISEPDKGIYDAMNKGVAAASGEWLLFINADDFLATKTVISDSVPFLDKTASRVAYGNVIFIYPSGIEQLQGVEWKKVKYQFRNIGMRLPHQSTFHSKSLFINAQFDTSFRITGDYDLLLRYLKDHDPEFIPLTIAKMRAGGISDTISKTKLLAETRKAQINNKIYLNFPSLNWIKYAAKLLTVDLIIRMIGIDGKERIKRIFEGS